MLNFQRSDGTFGRSCEYCNFTIVSFLLLLIRVYLYTNVTSEKWNKFHNNFSHRAVFFKHNFTCVIGVISYLSRSLLQYFKYCCLCWLTHWNREMDHLRRCIFGFYFFNELPHIVWDNKMLQGIFYSLHSCSPTLWLLDHTTDVIQYMLVGGLVGHYSSHLIPE